MGLRICYLLLTILSLFNCYNQPKADDTNCIRIEEQINDEWGILDKFDFTLTADSCYAIVERGGWIIRADGWGILSSTEYAPSEYFYEVYKQYHANGIIRERTKMMCNVMIESLEIFNQSGKLTRIVESDSKSAIFTREDVLRLLESEGWFNRQTGEMSMLCIERDASGIPYYVDKGIKKMKTDGTFYKEISNHIHIDYTLLYGDYHNRPAYWYVKIYSYDGKLYDNYYYYYTLYTIDSKTGEYTKGIHEEAASIE